MMKQIGKIVSIGILGAAGAVFLGRATITAVSRFATKIIMTDPYSKNLLELYSAASRTGAQTIGETNLRAEDGKVLLRPLGSPRHFVDFDGLMFKTAHLSKYPTPEEVPVDMTTIIGKKAQKPLVLDTPLMIAGMAYGLGVSEKAKYAMALGSKFANTATNTGEGPLLTLERKIANKLVLQYNRGTWNKDIATLREADAIEIQIGQGASASFGHTFSSEKIGPTLRKHLGLKAGESARINARMPELQKPGDLRKLVSYLRGVTKGVPIGIKISLSGNLDQDLAICLDGGVDFLALDGAQAGSSKSPTILEDDFGLPTIIGLCRALDYLEKTNSRKDVDLIIAGGLSTPGQFLKVLALGADAVYLGAVTIFAMTHSQVLFALPWEPPTQVIWYHGKYDKRYNWKLGGKHLGNFLKACTEEMQEGVRALGKTSLKDVGRDDLVALDQNTAAITGIPLAYGEAMPARKLKTRYRKRGR